MNPQTNPIGNAREKAEELRRLLRVELLDCDYEKWPNLCQRKGTAKGYQEIEHMVLKMVILEGATISGALATLESLYGDMETE